MREVEIAEAVSRRRTGRRPLQGRQRQARHHPDPGRAPAGDRGAGRARRVAPALLRRNVVVSGIPLVALKGRRFRIGEVVLEGTDDCDPCSRMEAALGAGRLQRDARPWRPVRAHRRRRQLPRRRCGGRAVSRRAGRATASSRTASRAARTRPRSPRWREAAERLGWTHERPDYTDLDARRDVSELGDVAARLARLLALAQAAAARGPLVLAGSSLGAYISGARVAARCRCAACS